MVFDSFFNSVFGFLIEWNPLVALIIISFILTALITIAYKYLTDQELMKSLKAELKSLQSEMKEAKHDTQKLMNLQKQSMEKNMKYMMNSFKPTLFTLIPLLIIFSWLRNSFTNVELNFFGISSWIWVYIIFSILFSIVLRKLLRVH
ncbi:DUF106 domain-containing protein [Candidatus Woesearchaeota archaeon]|nr:DUF106 domain-containing protein [Candidatus Woesearchaeota archaeon]